MRPTPRLARADTQISCFPKKDVRACQGLQTTRSRRGTRMTRHPCCLLPTGKHRHSVCEVFRRSMAGLHAPLSTLRRQPRGCPRMTRGRCGSLDLHRKGLSPSISSEVERFFALLTEKQLRRGIHRSTRELEHAIRHYIDTVNADPRPFRWTKSADDILDTIRRFCLRTLDTAQRQTEIIRTSESGH